VEENEMPKVYTNPVTTIEKLHTRLVDALAWATVWKQVAKYYRKKFYDEFDSGHYVKMELNKANTTATRRLELLRSHEWNSPPGTTEMWCVYCWNTWQQGHADDCKLAAELEDSDAQD
jgi:hypothetical protein